MQPLPSQMRGPARQSAAGDGRAEDARSGAGTLSQASAAHAGFAVLWTTNRNGTRHLSKWAAALKMSLPSPGTPEDEIPGLLDLEGWWLPLAEAVLDPAMTSLQSRTVEPNCHLPDGRRRSGL